MATKCKNEWLDYLRNLMLYNDTRERRIAGQQFKDLLSLTLHKPEIAEMNSILITLDGDILEYEKRLKNNLTKFVRCAVK